MRYSERKKLSYFPKTIDEVKWCDNDADLCFVRAQSKKTFGFGSNGATQMLAVDRAGVAQRLPGVHTITGDGYPDTFESFMSIIHNGFNTYPGAMNVFLCVGDLSHRVSDFLYDAEGIGNGKVTRSKRFAETRGDRYQLHLYEGFSENHTPHSVEHGDYGYGTVGVCQPNEIDSIVILDGGLNSHEVSQRINYYHHKIDELIGSQLLGFLVNGSLIRE